MLRVLLFLQLLCAPAMLLAEEGRFDRAVSAWLAGDDAQSLPMLSDLAQGGHAMARLLLARIETLDRGHSPYRAKLGPNASRALFRKDVGYGGHSRSWISVEADAGNPLAIALRASKHPRPDLGLIETLRGLGEHQATDYPTRMIALYGSDAERRALQASPHLLEELRPFLDYLTEAPEPRGDGMAALRHIAPYAAALVNPEDQDTKGIAGILALGYPHGDTSPDNRWRGLVEEWVLSAQATRPIADLCRARCASDVTGCAFALMALSGGYYEVVRLDTPLETVIAQRDFLTSPRARLMALRRAALAPGQADGGWLASATEIADMSSCAADVILAERRLYE